jgi:PAS domain S-box-containing protein
MDMQQVTAAPTTPPPLARMPSEEQLSGVLSEFARTMVTEFPIQAILDRLVQRIVDVLPITAAGVTLISPDARPRYVAASSESALRYEKFQTELGEGPCLMAYQQGDAVTVPDLHEDRRFPRFAAQALDAGLVAVFTFPLRHGDHQLGALNLYRDAPGPLDPGAMTAAQTLADVAAAYLLNAEARAEVRNSSERTERLAAIVESSNDSIIGWTSAGLISSWNSGAERIYGYAAEEAMDRDLSLIVSSEHLEVTARVHEKVLSGEHVAPFETEHLRSDGSMVDVALTVSPVRDRTGTTIGLSTVARDISENRRAVEALRNSQDRKGAILASALDAIITMDHEGCIDEFNPAAEYTFGLAAADVLGRKLADVIIPPELRSAHSRGLEMFLATGDGPLLRRRSEMSAMRSDGTSFPAEISISAVDTPGPPLFTGVVRDITERKAEEAERRSLEDRLHQSQRLESIGQLAGGVAHDFNNLLAVILNYVGFVAKAVADDPEAKHDVEQILAATQRAVRLTRQLLTFARRESIRPETLDLNAVVDEVQGLLARSIGEQIELVIRSGDDLPAFRADRGQTEQILLNLAVNARDAMPDGGTLTLETSSVRPDEDDSQAEDRTSGSGHCVRLSITDTGTGMSPEVANQAFDPFFTTKAKTEGTGLGLATVYGIIAAAGGTVNLHTNEGVGTTVEIDFPATEYDVASRELEPLPDALRGKGERVLVVEDQDAVREVAVRILRVNGYTVLEAASGADAISVWSEHDIDLLLTDVVMPHMTGPQLAEILRDLEPALPVLYMSGYAEGVLGPATLDDGVPLLEKPFDEAAILHSVHDTIAAGAAVSTPVVSAR